jgi:hypothetical protein
VYSEEDIRCDSVILLLVSFRTVQGASDFLQIGLQDSKQFVAILVKIGLQACEVPFIGSENRWTRQGDSSRQARIQQTLTTGHQPWREFYCACHPRHVMLAQDALVEEADSLPLDVAAGQRRSSP